MLIAWASCTNMRQILNRGINNSRSKMDARKIAVYLLLFFWLCFQCIYCVQLGNKEELLLKQVSQEFDTAQEDGWFDRTIEIQYKDAKLIPKIFIWCPIRHYGLTMNCPVHNCPLRLQKWTDVLSGARADPRNTRLVHDLHANLVLVQVFYECSNRLPGYQKNGHRYLSASNEVLPLFF